MVAVMREDLMTIGGAMTPATLRFIPMAAVQTSGTIFRKGLFIEATANGWVG